MLNRPVQLLRLERDQVRECDGPEFDGHVQDARDLDRQLDARVGAPKLANLALAGGRVRPVSVRHGASILRPTLFFFGGGPEALFLLTLF